MVNNNWTGGNPFLGMNNPFLQQNIDAAMGDITRNYNNAVKPNTESAMVGSGSFGNSGLMQMQGEQQRQLGATMGDVASRMRMQDYNQQQNMYQWDQGFQRGLFNDAFDQNQQQLSNYMGLLGTEAQFNQTDLTNANSIQDTPLRYQQGFSNMANGAGGAGGTSTGTTTAPGNPVMGAMGGWGLGGQFSNYFNGRR
jgi:hypothetical protein